MSDIRRIGTAFRVASRDPLAFLRAVARVPLQQQAAARIASPPVIELAELTGTHEELSVRLAPPTSRHGWSLGAAEQLILRS